MHVTAFKVVTVGSIVNNRDTGQPTTPIGNPSGLICRAQGGRVCYCPFGLEAAIVVIPTNPFIQIKELSNADDLVIQRLQTILHPDIIERPPCKSGLRITTKNRDRMVIDITSCASRIRLRVIPERFKKRVRTKLVNGDASRIPSNIRHGVQNQKSGNRSLLLGCEGYGCSLVKVTVQQTCISHKWNRSRDHIRKTASGNDPVEQSRVIVGNLVILIGAP